MRTSFLAKKQCAPPKAGLPSEPRIHWRKRAKQRGGCFATPTPYLLQNHLVRLRCVWKESDLRPLSYQDSVLPLNYRHKFYYRGQDSVLPLNYTLDEKTITKIRYPSKFA